MATSTNDSERATVKTYVPAEQKAIWKEHANQLGMSQSEFVRTMVQAGRRDFDVDTLQTGSGDANPGGEELKDQVLDLLSIDRAVEYDELVEMLIDDFEASLEEVLSELQASNTVQYSGRRGGYTLREHE